MDTDVAIKLHPPLRAIGFSIALLTVTVVPFFGILAARTYPGIGPTIDMLGALGATHVFATSYLLTDKSIRVFLLKHPIKLIAVPVAMIAGGALVLSVPATPLFVGSMLMFFLYQTWHFGAQNIGVSAFISFFERATPITGLEKNAIRAGVVCGMLGVLKVMSPGYMIGLENMPVPRDIMSIIDSLYVMGRYISIALTAVALGLLVRAWCSGHYMYGVAIFLSVTFLFAMYLSDDFMLGFMSFAIAHGLQYIVFLGAHSLSGRTKVRQVLSIQGLLIPPVAFLAVLWTARQIWTRAPSAISPDQFPMLGLGLVLSITLVHFWVDQFLWRMKNPERAAWVKSRFDFMFINLSRRKEVATEI